MADFNAAPEFMSDMGLVIVVNDCVRVSDLSDAFERRVPVQQIGKTIVADAVDTFDKVATWLIVAVEDLDDCVVVGKPLLEKWQDYFDGIVVLANFVDASLQARLIGKGILDVVVRDTAVPTRTISLLGLLVGARIKERRKVLQSEWGAAIFGDAIQNSIDGVWVVDDNHHFVGLNDAFTAVRGLGRKFVLGKHMSAVVDDKTRAWQEMILAKVSQGERGPFELSRQDHFGGRLDAEVSCSPFVFNDRTYVYGVVRNVTERNLAIEQADAQLSGMRELQKISSSQEDSFPTKITNFLSYGLGRLGVDDGIVLEVKGDYVVVKHGTGKSALDWIGMSVLKSAAFSYELINQRAASAINDFNESERNATDGGIPEQVKCLIGAPIIVGKEEYGALVFSGETPRGEKFTESDMLLVQLAAEWMAHEFHSQVAEQHIVEQERQLRLITDAAQEGIYTVDLQGEVVFVNPAAEKILGYSASELIGQDSHRLLHHSHADGSEYPAEDCKVRLAALQGGSALIGDEVFWRKDGTCFPVDYSVAVLGDSEVLGAVVLFRDVTERREAMDRLEEARNQLVVANERLSELAIIDGLSGIPNRRSFDEALLKETSRGSRLGKNKQLAMVMIDIDYFKKYNDTYGHQKGDQCLRKVAQAIKAAVKRPADLAARYGGEEFVLLLPDTDEGGAFSLAEEVRLVVESLATPHAARRFGGQRGSNPESGCGGHRLQ